MKKIKTKNNIGFTLVETLVAISILTISILGTFTAVQKGLASSIFAKDQVVAFYLIQESIEQIRNIRDTNGLESVLSQSTGGAEVDWLRNISLIGSDGCYNSKFCIIDPSINPSYPTSCSGDATTCPVLRQNSTTGLFGYNATWPLTKFKRSIQVLDVNAGREVVIVVTVSWTSGALSKTITVRQSLFNMH